MNRSHYPCLQAEVRCICLPEVLLRPAFLWFLSWWCFITVLMFCLSMLLLQYSFIRCSSTNNSCCSGGWFDQGWVFLTWYSLITQSPHSINPRCYWMALSSTSPALVLLPVLPGTANQTAVPDLGQGTDPAENSPAGRKAREEIIFPLLVLLSHILCLVYLGWSNHVLCYVWKAEWNCKVI